MSGTLDFITILFLIVAVVIFFKLRSVLGSRTGHERPPYDYGSQGEKKDEPYSEDNVVTLPRRNNDDSNTSVQEIDNPVKDIEERIKGIEPGSVLEDGIRAIAKQDVAFNTKEFLSGAKMAYEMIVVAYSEGNKQVLKPLLSSDVYESFEDEIQNREERDEVMDSSFVGINKANIIEAELKGSDAIVTLKFVSEMIVAVRNKKGEVLSGDPKKIIEVTDIWTFSRDVTSKDPNWKLIGTGSVN